MTAITDWADGKPCERHELSFCADCRNLAGIDRRPDGSLGYRGDCAVQTFAELTGAEYDEAVTILKANGYGVGRGTPVDGLRAALVDAGYTVREMTRLITPEAAAASGRSFFVAGWQGSKGHAWSIDAGQSRRGFYGSYRYRIFEVAA